MEEIRNHLEQKVEYSQKESDLAAAFSIRSIPSILFIPLEGIPQMMMGALPKSRFSDVIKNIFALE